MYKHILLAMTGFFYLSSTNGSHAQDCVVSPMYFQSNLANIDGGNDRQGRQGLRFRPERH
jgi:hypothetical protein